MTEFPSLRRLNVSYTLVHVVYWAMFAIFAGYQTSLLLGRGESLSSAAGEAAAFVRACAERTAAEDLPMREGVDFEPLLGLLIPGKETV